MMALNQGHGPRRKEEFRMIRNKADMRHEFLLCSSILELCDALRCPEKTHGKELKHPGE